MIAVAMRGCNSPRQRASLGVGCAVHACKKENEPQEQRLNKLCRNYEKRGYFLSFQTRLLARLADKTNQLTLSHIHLFQNPTQSFNQARPIQQQANHTITQINQSINEPTNQPTAMSTSERAPTPAGGGTPTAPGAGTSPPSPLAGAAHTCWARPSRAAGAG
jgi:hypothetical protein